MEGSEAEADPKGRMPVAERDIMVGEPFLVDALGTSSYTLPSSINLFVKHLIFFWY